MSERIRHSNLSSNDDLTAWQRRLGRVRLGAEPIDEQLSRLRRVTWTLTGVAAGIGTVIFALFTAFGAPATGAVVAGVLFGPIVALAWFDELKRVSTARAFFRAHPEQSAGAGK